MRNGLSWILMGSLLLGAGCSAVDRREAKLMQEITLLGESFSSSIEVEGSDDFKLKVRRALGLIYLKDPDNWVVVKRNLTKIKESKRSGITVSSGVFTTTNSKYKDEYDFGEDAVHDAWHREYWVRREVWRGEVGERKCIERQNEFLKRVGRPENDVEDALKTRYWEVPYKKRDW